jgi:CHAT domain-containing protein
LSSRYSLLSVYSDRAKINMLLAEKGQDTEGYQKALILFHKIIELADDIRADYFSDEAKLTLANDAKPALEKAIGLCQKLYAKTQDKQYLEQAFGFVEYSRSMVLYENARLENQLPSDLKAENEELKRLERDLIPKNDVEKLQNYLRLKRQFRERIKALNRNKLASVADLQKAIIKDDKTAFIEFFVGDSSIFVFSLLQNEVKLIEFKKEKDFEKQIENLRNEVIKKEPSKDAMAFAQQSNRLYNDLLKSSIDALPKTVNQLIIAPDGVLHYVPFDILVKTPPSVNFKDSKDFKGSKTASKDSSLITHNSSLKKDSSFIVHHSSLHFKDCEFLLRSYIISSAYSANLLLEQKRPKKEANKALFAGFASKYEENDPRFVNVGDSQLALTRGSSGDLKWAREEASTISSLMNGKAYIDTNATEGVFKREANHYRILHFAMHGMVDDKDAALSKLLFTLTPQDTTNDSNLTAAELYTMPLNADLAVVSACNTGFGTLNKGEGVMSLARAFTYAGVPATVTSLWPAPDRMTKKIMVDFYKNLKQGMTKDAALTAAKRTYLLTADRSIEANPFFWGAFVPMGNMEAVDMTEKGPLSIWAILAAAMGLGGLGFWYWKRKRN